MIITVEDKKASVQVGEDTYHGEGFTQWEAVRKVLMEIQRDYKSLQNVAITDLTEEALERKKLLQEIVE
jgi:hypothetical protein